MSIVTHEPVAPEVVEPLAEPDKVLLRANALLRERGWNKGDMGLSAEGPVCLIGAIALTEKLTMGEFIAYPSDVPRSRSYAARRAVVRLARSLGWQPRKRDTAEQWVLLWNDDKERTAKEVAEALERAAYGL